MTSFETPASPRLLLFPASLRKASHQRRLVEYLAKSLVGSCHIDVLGPGDVDLPLYNQDLEADPSIVARVIAVHARFAAADGLIVASPEYNGHVSPYLKNTVDWISRLPRIDARFAAASAFRGKPVMLTCASTGWSGGVLGLQDARTIFSYLGCVVSPEQVCVSDADHWCASGAYVFEPPFADFIETALGGFVSLVDSLRVKHPIPVQQRRQA